MVHHSLSVVTIISSPCPGHFYGAERSLASKWASGWMPSQESCLPAQQEDRASAPSGTLPAKAVLQCLARVLMAAAEEVSFAPCAHSPCPVLWECQPGLMTEWACLLPGMPTQSQVPWSGPALLCQPARVRWSGVSGAQAEDVRPSEPG